jgi:hypothetical protein
MEEAFHSPSKDLVSNQLCVRDIRSDSVQQAEPDSGDRWTKHQ